MLKYIKGISFLMLVTAVMISCSSLKDTAKPDLKHQKELVQDTISKSIIVPLKKSFTDFEFEGEATIFVNNDEINGNIEGGYISKEQLILNVFGPFGIHIASIEVKGDTLKIANLWHKKYYQTKFDIKSKNIELSLLELARKLIIAEPLSDEIMINQNTDTLNFEHNFTNGTASYNYIVSSNYIYYKKLKIEHKDIKLKYSKYKKIGINNYPLQILIEVNEFNIKINLDLEDIRNLNNLQKFKSIDYSKLQKVDEINKLAK